jgi:hypothetical protein
MRIVAQNPAPIARQEFVRVATPDGFKRMQIALQPSAIVETDFVPAEFPVPAPTFVRELPLALVANGAICEFELIDTSEEPPCLTLHFRGRIPNTTFVADLWATVGNAGVVPFELLIVNSDPRSGDVYSTLTADLYGLFGTTPFVYYAPWRSAYPTGRVVSLLRNETFADTQGQAWFGFLSFAGADVQQWEYGPAMAMSTPAEWAGKWGPFGVLPDWPGYTAAMYIVEIRDWFISMIGASPTPWKAPNIGLAPNANQTGGQQEFGTSKLGPAFMGGVLHASHAAQAASMETCRPGDFRESDGSPVDPANHPNWVTWNFYTHFHPSVSSDRLGKVGMPTWWQGNWGGKDREHWSSLTLCGAYLLTGSPLLLHRIEVEARLFLAGETLDPRLSTSGIGAPRGIGRTFLTAAWIDCCLPEGNLRSRLRERVLARLTLVEEKTRRETLVAPLGLVDHPSIPDKDLVAPWQEAQGIIGLRAAQLQFEGADAICQPLLARVCRTFVEYGWWLDSHGWQMADYHDFNDGAPLPSEAYPGPLVQRREGFEEWSWGAVKICNAVLHQSQRAQALLQALPAPSKVVDAEWIAVR